MVSTHRGQGIQAMKIGILAVQGDFAAHAAMPRGNGRRNGGGARPEDLADCDGLILPGGEKHHPTAISCKKKACTKRSRNLPPKTKLFSAHARVRFCWLPKSKSPQESLGLLDMTVLRNGYGRQVHSDVVSDPLP